MTFRQSSSPLSQSPEDLEFQVSPILYNGEDGLHLLHSAIAIGASYDSIERYPPPRCHPQTRKVVFEIILAWTKNALRGPRIMWIHGEAGSGKSAISQTVAEYCVHSGQLGASFFFAHNKGDLSDGKLLFPTIAYKLASAIPGLRAPISRAIQSNTSILTQSLEVQVQKLIIEPYRMIRHPPIPTLIIIDGLDACEGTEMQQRVLTIIVQLLVVHRLPLCFFITSRLTPTLQATFDNPMFRKVATRIPLDVFVSDDDVRTFLRSEFASIRQHRAHTMVGITDPWASADAIEMLVNKAGGGFLYPATVVRYVDDPRAPERLVETIVTAALPAASAVDQFYHHVLSRAADTAGGPMALLRTLGPLCVLFAPLPPRELEILLDIHPEEVSAALAGAGVHALVDLPRSPGQAARIAQPSTVEFFTDLSRALHFWVDAGAQHAALARGCIRYLTEFLDGMEDVNLSSYQYARRRWIKHLANASPTPALLDELRELRFMYSRTRAEVREVVYWLQNLHTTVLDLQQVWQNWQAEMQAHSAFYSP